MANALGKHSPQIVEHSGFEYDVREIYKYLDGKTKVGVAILRAYPKIKDNPKHVSAVAAKVRLHPYFKARKDATLDIIASRDADLQLNMLDLAFGARSEKVKYDATKDSLDRIHGTSDDGAGNGAPVLIFNFDMSGGGPQKPVRRVVGEKPVRDAQEGEIIDADD